MTNSGANVISRHDYLPFGEELGAEVGGRTTGMGFPGTSHSLRQKFTSKERDVETGLDYFGSRYYASMQGRFTGADPYDINLERQNTSDAEEADDLFTNYLEQPQHWNHYEYCLNNPFKFIDPNGLYEYKTELLGKKITVKIDDNIRKNNPRAFNKIKDNIDNAIAKINSVQKDLSAEQIKKINSMNGIEVSSHFSGPGMNPESKVFQMSSQFAQTDDPDTLPAAFVHDSQHADQKRRGDKYKGVDAEKDASCFTVPILKLMRLGATVIKAYEFDCQNGHGNWGPGPKSRAPKRKF